MTIFVGAYRVIYSFSGSTSDGLFCHNIQISDRVSDRAFAENKGSEALWGDYTVLFSKCIPPFLQHPPKTPNKYGYCSFRRDFKFLPFSILASSGKSGSFLHQTSVPRSFAPTVLGIFKVLDAVHIINILMNCFIICIYKLRIACQLKMWNYLSSLYYWITAQICCEVNYFPWKLRKLNEVWLGQQGAMNMFNVHFVIFIQGILINISWMQASMLARAFDFLQSQEFKVHFFHIGWRCK